MIGKERIREILERALKSSAADATSCTVILEDSALTRFAGGQIHQNVAEESVKAHVKAILGKRSGSASASSIDEDSINGAVSRAIENARQSPELRDMVELPGPQDYPPVETYDAATGECTPKGRALAVRAAVREVESRGVEAYGSVETSAQEAAVANSRGLFAYAPLSGCGAVVATIGREAYGSSGASSRNMGDIDFAALGVEAAERCLAARNPASIPAGRYDVILLEYAVADIIRFLCSLGFGPTAYREGRSFMTGKIGQKVMGDNITIWDDGLDTGGMPLPFDTEGVPKKRVALITKGVAAGVVYDTAEALKAGTSSTGHAFPYGAFIGGAMPTNAFLKPGPATVDEMIASTDHGLLVTRFHYTRAVDPRRVVITGMTRDGTFLIRDGKIAGAVKNLRFTESYVEAMSRVEAISARTKIQGGRIGAAVVPALKITNFNFTGVTEF